MLTPPLPTEKVKSYIWELLFLFLTSSLAYTLRENNSQSNTNQFIFYFFYTLSPSPSSSQEYLVIIVNSIKQNLHVNIQGVHKSM